MRQKDKKYISTAQALQKLQAYCAYQDRCHQEVRSKLLDLGIYGDELEEIIVSLIEDKFLNEERFACSFARGKFRYKKWGKLKITQALKRKNISAYCLKKAMEEIEETDYTQTIDELIAKKHRQINKADTYTQKQRIARFLFQKGYESTLSWERINLFFDTVQED
ncbi:MAG: regulatory protein RecX [Bacteroidota bacterium]